MVSFGLLTALLLVASATDMRRGKIYNWTTYSGMLAALILNVAGSWWEFGRDPLYWQNIIGWVTPSYYTNSPLTACLLGFAACGGCMVMCFVFFGVAGGDVKLIAMMGAFLGFEQGILAMLWTLIIGGAAGMIVLIWRVGAANLAVGISRRLFSMIRYRSMQPLTEDERQVLQARLYLAPTTLPAVLIVKFQLLQWVL